jgi:hypothetical protein
MPRAPRRVKVLRDKKAKRYVVAPTHLVANRGDRIRWENRTDRTITVYLPPHRFVGRSDAATTIEPGKRSRPFRIGRRAQDRGFYHYGVRVGRNSWAEGSEPAVIVK